MDSTSQIELMSLINWAAQLYLSRDAQHICPATYNYLLWEQEKGLTLTGGVTPGLGWNLTPQPTTDKGNVQPPTR